MYLGPLAIAAPALLAGAAWLNAKTQFSYDLRLVASLTRAGLTVRLNEKLDRVNLFYCLEKHATTRNTSDRSFIVFNGKEWTFKEVYDIVLRYGTWLKKTLAIAPGDVVAIDFMNSAHFVFIWLALWSLGARPAFINYNLTGKPLLHCIKTSTARVVLVDEKCKAQFTPEVLEAVTSPKFRDGKGPVEVVFFSEVLEQQILAEEGKREPDSVRSGAEAHEMASLMFTSGTTGLPKAAIVSWYKSTVGGKFASLMMTKPNDRFYTCMPMYHASAALLAFGPCLVGGTTFIIGDKFSTRNFWIDVRTSNATIIQYVGETCRYLLAAPPQIDANTGENLDRKHNVRLAFGNGLRPDIWDRFKERFGIETICEFYSATESPQAVWNISSNDFSKGAIGRNGSLSAFLLKFQVAIVALNWETEQPSRSPKTGLCIRVPPGSPGELLCKVNPANIEKGFQGYFNDAKATEAKILRDVIAKGDAWFRTGDVIRWDHEGRWFFCDRIGDTFRWKSENVSTTEVSEALGHHPAIQEANVYGVELPHHDGRAGCAAILLEGDINQALLNELATHASKTLPKFAIPIFLRIVREIQATGNNKQQKHLLRAQGVEPKKLQEDGDKVFWLKGGSYVEFEQSDWESLEAGRTQL